MSVFAGAMSAPSMSPAKKLIVCLRATRSTYVITRVIIVTPITAPITKAVSSLAWLSGSRIASSTYVYCPSMKSTADPLMPGSSIALSASIPAMSSASGVFCGFVGASSASVAPMSIPSVSSAQRFLVVVSLRIIAMLAVMMSAMKNTKVSCGYTLMSSGMSLLARSIAARIAARSGSMKKRSSSSRTSRVVVCPRAMLYAYSGVLVSCLSACMNR